MKYVILHGTGASHESNWFPWLKYELEQLGHEVWIPDLPDNENPDARRWTKFLIESGYDFNDSILIGHSAGAVEVQALLQALPVGTETWAAVMVGIFRGDLG